LDFCTSDILGLLKEADMRTDRKMKIQKNTCLTQISIGNHYNNLHSPHQIYILSFLFAKLDDKEKADFYFDKYLKDRYQKLNLETKNQIREKLITLADKA
jgi:hypothetical protein